MISEKWLVQSGEEVTTIKMLKKMVFEEQYLKKTPKACLREELNKQFFMPVMYRQIIKMGLK